MQRQQAIDLIESLGGRVTSSVSGKTDAVIIGANPGKTKTNDAAKKQVPTISWPMLRYLGILDPRDGYKLENIDEDLISTLILHMAFITEDLYVASRNDVPGADESYQHAGMAIESVLQAAYGKSKGRNEESDDRSTKNPNNSG